jgi:hypothetical protein
MAKPNPSKEDRPINQSVKLRPVDRATVALILKGHAELTGLTDAIRYALAHWRRTEGKDADAGNTEEIRTTDTS